MSESTKRFVTSKDMMTTELDKTIEKEFVADAVALKQLNDRLQAIENVSVTGVKGNAESSYRHGDVNMTLANIGYESVNNLNETEEGKLLDARQGRALSGSIMSISGRVDVVSSSVLAIGGRMDAISSSILSISGQVNTMSGSILSIGGKVDALSGSVMTIGGMVDALSGSIMTIGGKVDAMSGSILAIGGRVDSISSSILSISGEMNALSGSIMSVSGMIDTLQGDIATIETSSTSAHAYAKDDFLVYRGQFYKVLQSISIGDTLTVGTNIAATKIADNFGSGGGGGAVTGVKGNAETLYRTGNVNITPDNIGAVDTSKLGVANGVAELDGTGKLKSSQLPSSVDDIVEGYYNLTDGKFYKESTYATEIEGEADKIYLSLDTNLPYRWSGSTFAEIPWGLALGETSSTAYRGDRGKAAYDTSNSNKTAISKLDADFATVETDAESSAHAYNIGDYFVIDHTLCRATSAIAIGDAITIGTNAVAIVIMEELATNFVKGVKGNSESSYRHGNINMTLANLGYDVANNLTTDTAGYLLDARQGKVLSSSILSVSGMVEDLQSDIATVEESTTSAHSYAKDEYLILTGKFYKTTQAVNVGDTLAVGTNITQTKVSDNFGSGGGGGHTIINSSGTAMTQRGNLQFKGGVSVTDDSANDTTVVEITGGGAIVVQKPTVTVGSYTYDGTQQGPTIAELDPDTMTITGTYEATNVGEYTFTVALKNTNTMIWNDGTTTDLTYTWNIEKATVTVPTVTGNTKTYNGSSQSPSITRDTSHTSISGTTSATKVGTYNFTISLTDTANYKWSDSTTAEKSYTWEIDEPDGSTYTPVNDIQAWLQCASIDKSYTALSEVLADSTTLAALMLDNNAVDYLVRSTSWVSDITSNQTAMTDIGADDYCADTLLADSTWRTAICNSTYFESVLNAKVPVMTSNTTPSGTVISANPEWTGTSSGGGHPWNAFDRNSNTWFNLNVIPTESSPGYIQVDFGKNVAVRRFDVVNYSATTALKDFKILGSANGSSWTEITTTLSNPANDDVHTFVINNNYYYRYYRVMIYSLYNTDRAMAKEMQLYGRVSS